jgi:hypothetical protein
LVEAAGNVAATIDGLDRPPAREPELNVVGVE